MREVPKNAVRPGIDLAYEVLHSIEDRLDDGTFAAFLCALADKYSKAFIEEEFHAEFFDDMADNFKLFAKVIRQSHN